MKGIDVSSNQGIIYFAQVKASGIEIVYIKATQGISYTNPYLATHYKDAKANNLKIGFYHFMDSSDPTLQAQHFLNTISGMISDCKYVIDIEDQTKWTVSTASNYTRIFADYLISHGKEPAIYTGDYFYRDNLNSTVKDLPLWVAAYGGTPMANCYNGLQSSETGRIDGINGNVDIDWFDDGILLKTKVVIPQPIIIKEVKRVKNLVIYGNETDKRAAEYLADYLGCALIDGRRPYADYGTIENVYGVGAKPITNGVTGWTSYMKDSNIVIGKDEFETMQKVLDVVRLGIFK